MRRTAVAAAAVAVAAALPFALAPRTAHAKEELIIKQPDQHPDYVAELDVHGVFAYGPTLGRYDVIGFGPGLHANFRLLKNGFIPNLNNNIALGVGAGLVFDANYGDVRLVTAVVMQWNFWLTAHWSVFGEPGLSIEFPMSTPRGPEPLYFSPALAVGGRYNFNEHVALVIRLGFPVSSVGVSFFL